MNKPKRTRKKREIDVKIDTPNVDVELTKDLEGNLSIDVDSKRIDAHIEKTDEKLSIELTIEDKETYYFEANGSDGRMKKGALVKVSGEILKILLKRKFGKFIKKA